VTGIVACIHLLKSSSIKRLLIFLLLIILKEASKRKAHVWGNYTAQKLRSKVNNISTQKRLRRKCVGERNIHVVDSSSEEKKMASGDVTG